MTAHGAWSPRVDLVDNNLLLDELSFSCTQRPRAIWVGGDEVFQHQPESLYFFFVAVRSGLLDIVEDDFAQMRHTVFTVDKILPEFRGNDFRYVFVLCDRFDFLFREFTHANAVL